MSGTPQKWLVIQLIDNQTGDLIAGSKPFRMNKSAGDLGTMGRTDWRFHEFFWKDIGWTSIERWLKS